MDSNIELLELQAKIVQTKFYTVGQILETLRDTGDCILQPDPVNHHYLSKTGDADPCKSGLNLMVTPFHSNKMAEPVSICLFYCVVSISAGL